MFLIFAYLTLTKFVVSQNMLGVSYTFDTDFERTFNRNNCEDRDMWRLVDYESVGIEAPHQSDKAIQALSNSCATSFPIILIPESTLDVYVYIGAVSNDSGVVITVLNGDKPVASNIYNRSCEDFVAGWSEISLLINNNGIGYINLLGNSRDNDIVLIDSFRYTPNETKIENKINDDPDALIFNVPKEYTITEHVEGDIDESSGDHEYENDFDEGSGDDIQDAPVIDATKENTESIGLWAITLIVTGGLTVLGLLVISAYHVGKNRGMAQNPLIHIDEITPPRFPIIPRVRGASSVTPNERIRSF